VSGTPPHPRQTRGRLHQGCGVAGDRLDTEAVAEVLLVDPNTVRAHFKRYVNVVLRA